KSSWRSVTRQRPSDLSYLHCKYRWAAASVARRSALPIDLRSIFVRLLKFVALRPRIGTRLGLVGLTPTGASGSKRYLRKRPIGEEGRSERASAISLQGRPSGGSEPARKNARGLEGNHRERPCPHQIHRHARRH